MFITVSKVCKFNCNSCKHLVISTGRNWKMCNNPNSKIEKKSDGRVYCSGYLKRGNANGNLS